MLAGSSADGSLDELYREVVLDHHRSPRGRRPLGRVDRVAEGRNPTCGDEVRVELSIDGDRVTDMAVVGHGCAISVASGSMLAELVRGRTIAEARSLTRSLGQLLRGEPVDGELELGDLEALAGVRKFPARVKCAALPAVTLANALGGGPSLITTEPVTRDASAERRLERAAPERAVRGEG